MSTLTAVAITLCLAAPPRNLSTTIDRTGLPYRVHVFEDYETDIEKRWWLRGTPVTDVVPPSSSKSVSNKRACRATMTKDFDRKMGDQSKMYKAVIFNPVPGPPMGKSTRLSFRYRLKGTDTLRVQIYSLSKGYHRHLILKDLPQGKWRDATVDMTKARRPDGSGGPLAEDERIDDIQFYIDPSADLWIDDIVLYDAAVKGEKRPFPKRFMFTGWFDTGKQGNEWPGDFKIVLHNKPLTWDAAESIKDPKTGKQSMRIGLRGMRPLSKDTRLRFRYRYDPGPDGGRKVIGILLLNSEVQNSRFTLVNPEVGEWAEVTVFFTTGRIETIAPLTHADQIYFDPEHGKLQVDDLLLYEPGKAEKAGRK